MKIAWIGNSFIYFNDLPTMVGDNLSASGLSHTIQHGQVTPGGQTFSGHAKDPNVHALLQAQPPWDVVVLQDNSGIPGGFDPAALAASQRDLRESIAPLVPPTATTVCVFGTWGHIRGSVYEAQRAAYPDYTTMQRLTTKGCEWYVDILRSCLLDDDKGDGDTPSVVLVPVGDAFEEVYREEISLGRDPLEPTSLFAQLYQPDAFHPSRLGSYLASCVFTHVLRASSSVSGGGTGLCRHDAKLRGIFGDGWKPEVFEEEDAVRLQRAALKAVDGRRSI